VFFSIFLNQALRAKANKDASPQGAPATCFLSLLVSLVDITMVVNPVNKAWLFALADGGQRKLALVLEVLVNAKVVLDFLIVKYTIS